MTKPIADFKVPAVKRAIRVAHAQGLAVQSYDIKRDGSIHIELRDYQVASDGTVRVLDNGCGVVETELAEAMKENKISYNAKTEYYLYARDRMGLDDD